MDLALIKKALSNPKDFVELIFGITEERDNDKFMKGRHYTWQQSDILDAVSKAHDGTWPKRVAIRSWHGVWKSSSMSWVLLWYLLSHKEAQIACTANTWHQLHDVLWKEVAKWMAKLPPELSNSLDLQRDYIRVIDPKVEDSGRKRFARAKTARKEKPEALAWVHGDYVLIIVDEASWVPDEVYNVMEWALTEENIIVVMISNPTRTHWYFYDAFHSDQENRNNLHFTCLQSPLVDNDYVKRISWKHGIESDEYRIRVLGEFPKEDYIDDKWYVNLIMWEKVIYTAETWQWGTSMKLGVDPAWEWKDETARVLRDWLRARLIAKEKTSSTLSIAQKTSTLMFELGITDKNVYIDNFWVGANVAQELALMWHQVNWVNVWDKAKDTYRFINKRSEAYRAMRERLYSWWELIYKEHRETQLQMIKYRRNLQGRIQMMSKRDIRKAFGDSPDIMDALMLTFYDKKEQYQNDEPVMESW